MMTFVQGTQQEVGQALEAIVICSTAGLRETVEMRALIRTDMSQLPPDTLQAACTVGTATSYRTTCGSALLVQACSLHSTQALQTSIAKAGSGVTSTQSFQVPLPELQATISSKGSGSSWSGWAIAGVAVACIVAAVAVVSGGYTGWKRYRSGNAYEVSDLSLSEVDSGSAHGSYARSDEGSLAFEGSQEDGSQEAEENRVRQKLYETPRSSASADIASLPAQSAPAHIAGMLGAQAASRVSRVAAARASTAARGSTTARNSTAARASAAAQPGRRGSARPSDVRISMAERSSSGSGSSEEEDSEDYESSDDASYDVPVRSQGCFGKRRR